MEVIGLHGAKGSGKDQFYKTVSDHFPHLDIRQVAFADPIRNVVEDIFNLQNEQQYDKFKRNSFVNDQQVIPGRDIVRKIGMLMRSYDEDQFIQYVRDRITSDPNAIWIVTDVRFRQEFDFINSIGGVVVKIKRNLYDGHVTETEIADELCDHVIDNRELTLDQYNEAAIQAMYKLVIDGV